MVGWKVVYQAGEFPMNELEFMLFFLCVFFAAFYALSVAP